MIALHLAIVYEVRHCAILIVRSLMEWIGRYKKVLETCYSSSEGVRLQDHFVGVRFGTMFESDQLSWKTSDARPQMPSSRAGA